MSWDPAQYLAFAGPRLQPAVDLLSRIALPAPKLVFDLGCGAGNVTKLLRWRWTEARIVGVDSSPEMLKRAAAESPGTEWREADLAIWRPEAPADLVYSNAALHWLDDHATLFPRLLDALVPGGVLAVQMPRNHGAPSHTGMTAVAEAGAWSAKLRPVLRQRPVAEPGFYYDLLAPRTGSLEIWETEYLHVLEGADPVVEWTKGTALKPLLDALAGPERIAFLADYSARMRAAYPPRSDGRTLFPFRRLFILATRR